MITERDLLEAIAECQGERDPNANTCIKLAAYYTILQNMRDELPGYSNTPAPIAKASYNSGSDFAKAIEGKDPDKIWPIIDELMLAVRVMNPRTYAAVISELKKEDG